MVIRCPQCGQGHAWRPQLAGTRVKCKCGGRIEAPMQFVQVRGRWFIELPADDGFGNPVLGAGVIPD